MGSLAPESVLLTFGSTLGSLEPAWFNLTLLGLVLLTLVLLTKEGPVLSSIIPIWEGEWLAVKMSSRPRGSTA